MIARFAAAVTAMALLAAPVARAGEPAQDFSLRDMRGQTVELSDYEGKVIFVDFWATWCGPCKDAMPHWQRMHDELADEGLVVLAVTTDDARTKPQVKPFIKRSGYTYPVLYDTDSSALVLYNPNKTLPFSVIIDRDFEVHEVHAGYTPGDEVEIRETVEDLLAGTPSDASQGDGPATQGEPDEAAQGEAGAGNESDKAAESAEP